MILDVNAVTLTGLVREINQDSIFSAFLCNIGLFVVADGMGGHYHGEIASEIVVTEIEKWWEQNKAQIEKLSFVTIVDFLEEEIKRINNIIVENYHRIGQVGGSTFCALLLHYNTYAVFNIGDSRLYLYKKHKMRLLTIDDVWENLPQVRQMINKGQFSGDTRMGKLVKAMGINREISMSIFSNTIEKRMVFFLCSDGIYRYLEEWQLKNLLRKVKKIGDAALINKKIQEKVYENGAFDNIAMITVLVLKK